MKKPNHNKKQPIFLKVQPKDKFIYSVINILSYVFGFLSLALVMLLIGLIQNMFYGLVFLLIFGLVGGIIGYFFTSYLKKKVPLIQYKESNKKSIITPAFFLFFLIGFPMLMYEINSHLKSTISYESSSITEKRRTVMGRGWYNADYLLTIKIENREKELKVKSVVWNSFNVGDSIKVKIVNGTLGFRYVTEIDPSSFSVSSK